MKKHTVCRMCSSCCPIIAETKDGRLIAATRKSIFGASAGFDCAKLNAATDIVYSDKRLLHPLIRKSKNAELEEASWDEALDLVAEKFLKYKQQSSPESVAWLRGMAADWGAPWDYANRLMNSYGSPNTIGNGSICFVAREMAHSYTYGVMSYPEAAATELIMVWGKHDGDTALGMAEAIAKGRENGATLVVIDPVRTPLAARADIWLQIKPGYDGMLAMAIINTIIEEKLFDHDFVENFSVGFDELKTSASAFSPEQTAEKMWLDSGTIRRVARLYATTKPACIVDGNGLDMQLDMFQATRAIALLRGLCGNIDHHGGDVLPQPINVLNIQKRDGIDPAVAAITANYPLFDDFNPTWGRQVQSCVIDAILDKIPYPLEMLIVQAGNPVVTMADAQRAERALQEVGFLVVIDMFLTRSAALGDVILPASSCFEKTQLNRAGIRNNPIILQDQVIEPVGDSWPDWKIVFELGRRIGLTDEFPWQSAEEAIDYQLSPTGVTVHKLRENESMVRVEAISYQKYRDTPFTTPSGKFEFFSQKLADNDFDGTPYLSGYPKELIAFEQQSADYPFIGISGARDIRYTNSQYRQIPALLQNGKGCKVDIHPADGAGLGIDDGERVIIRSPKGKIKMRAKFSDLVHPGSVRIAWGWGDYNKECSLNVLTDDSRRNPITGTPAMRSFRCLIEKMG